MSNHQIAGPGGLDGLEEALRSSKELTQAVMDSLAAHIAVLDSKGNIIATNAAWERFALENSAGEPRNTGIGVNYLGVCRSACGPASEGAVDVESGIRAVIDGSAGSFQIEYPCHSPDEQRWFLLQANGLRRGSRGVVLLHINITERKLLEGKLLDAERLKVLTTGLISGQEDERRRLARELHDGLNQRVAVLSIELGLIAPRVEESIRAEIKKLQQTTIELSDQVRRISHRLHPAALEHLGLLAALRSFVQEFSAAHSLDVRLFIADEVAEPGRGQALCLYRVAQESLTNVARHSGAGLATISLMPLKDGGVEMLIEDDGRGFEVAGIRGRGGLGLVSMEERVRLAGGSFQVSSNPGCGTRVQVRITGTR